MKRDAVIKAIKAVGRRGAAIVTIHAREEIENKHLGIAEQEINAALAAGTSFTLQANGRWLVYSAAFDLSVVVLLDEARVVVWTVF